MEVDVNVDARALEGVTEFEAKRELDRLLSDPQFHSTDRNRNFLRFVATEMFEGRAAAVKAYTIAVDVFGRPCSFDPTTDPIVRIEATRLRASLAQYYETHDDEGSVRIELPRGRYIPVFTKAPPHAESLYEAEFVEIADDKDTYSGWREAVVRRRLGLAALGAVICAFLWLISGRAPVFSEKPNVAVEMKSAGNGSDTEAGFIRDYLMTALSQYQTLKLAAEEIPDNSRGSVIRAASSFLWSNRRTSASYKVILKYHTADDARSVWWQVVDPVTGEALRSGVEQVAVDDKRATDVRRELVMRLANRFADMNGVINGLELTRELASPALGNGCVLRSAMALRQRDAAQLQRARTCLEKSLAATPDDAAINAELAIVNLELAAPGVPNEATARALNLANRAVSLSPTSDRAAYAQMLAQCHNGLNEAAFVSGYRALGLNPNNSLIAARLGVMLFSHGRWAEGAGMAIKSGMIEGVLPGDAVLTLALDAYRREDFAQALLRVQQMGRSDDYVANILELAAAGQIQNAAGAREAAKRLNAQRSEFALSFRSEMAARHYAHEIVEKLAAGLEKAGFPLPSSPPDRSY
jgi:tetratricopeptide (TPR) repeat protein